MNFSKLKKQVVLKGGQILDPLAKTSIKNDILIENGKIKAIGKIKSSKSGEEIIIVQIAGLIARRIVCEVEQGQTLKQGERIGMIRFGSRVDVYFHNKKILAKIGQNVIAGESLIASD